jgi:hypothetical protein
VRWGEKYLHGLEIKFNGKFEEHVIKKVSKYQSIQLQFVANNFSKLNRRINSAAEAERNILFFLMSVLYDEIIDNQLMDEAQLNLLFQHPSAANTSNFNERVLVYIHQELIKQVVDKDSYWNTLQLTHLAQLDSKKQFDPNITTEQIIDITKRKGGYTLLMCRHYLIDPSSEAKDHCWYVLGGLIQMTNDLYDTYKDTQDGIHTFANQMKDIATLIDIYTHQVNAFNDSIRYLPHSKIKKMEFAINMSMIPSFGYVAINQLNQLQDNSKTLPNFSKVKRKDLIIDMEKIGNIMRLIKFSYKYGKSWM